MSSRRLKASPRIIIRAVPPFRLDFTVWALRRRPRNAIDRWDGTTYRRIVIIGTRVTELAIQQSGSAAAPRVVVTAAPAVRTRSDRRQVAALVDRLLGLQVDLAGWYELVRHDRRLSALAARFRGLKPPRFPTVFEALVNGFACQQLSLVVGLELLNRLAAVCQVRREPGGSHYAFPGPRDVAARPATRYRAIGFSHQKVRAMLALARGVNSGAIDLDTLDSDDDAEVCARLLRLRGVGRWTAEYVSLRGLGRLNVFPGDDVGAQNSLAKWLGRTIPLDYPGVITAVERWQPYAGMVYLHLLLDGLRKSGALESQDYALVRRKRSSSIS